MSRTKKKKVKGLQHNENGQKTKYYTIKKDKEKKKKKVKAKMLRWTESNNINRKGPRLSKLRKVFAPGPSWH